MEKQSVGRKASGRPTLKLTKDKVPGASALQFSDNGTSNLVGSIVERGIFDDQPIATSSSTPRPSVLPFPVARHRAHGPHWGPKVEESYEDDEEDNDDKIDAMNYGPISQFANPMKKKKKKGLDMSNWRDLLSSDGSHVHWKETEKSAHSHVQNQKVNTEGVKVESRSEKAERSLASDAYREHTEPIDSMDLDRFTEPSSVTNLIGGGVKFVNEKDAFASVSMDYECKVVDDVKLKTLSPNGSKGRGISTYSQETRMHARENSTSHGFDGAQEAEFDSLEKQIDAENEARLRTMSPEEIAVAQSEIRDKFNPKLLNLFTKRGKDKKEKGGSAKTMSSSSDETSSRDKKDVEHPLLLDTTSSPSAMPATLQEMKRRVAESSAPVISPDGGIWDAWSKRVEAVRNIRFSMDGNAMQLEFLHSTTSVDADLPADVGYSAVNVAERDFLRTEGDPAAAGYTIKEALALSRSVVPGQRALALQLLSSVLNNALQNIHQDLITVNNLDNMKEFVDWEAVWAFALGPEPDLVLSLRLSLDDNHSSVVLACAKAIQCILAYDLNEQFFNISDQLTSQEKHLYTAPIFRSKPDIQGGFLHGGFWKYNAKPSNILDSNILDSKDEEEKTIKDDSILAGQDIVAGLLRMDVLPRLRYLLETNPAVLLEECILSILVAIARHSPTCADAILNCERLVQTIQDRFMLNSTWESQGCKMKSVKLVRVLAQSNSRNCSEFVKNRTFERMMWQLYQVPASLNDWVVAGKERCILSSQLMVEQLRFWKVCIKYGHCISYFTDFYPAICLWLNPPTVEKLIEKDVLQEYASVSTEVYLVLVALSEKLPNWNPRKSSRHISSDACNDDTASWCWSDAASIVDIALQWIVLDPSAPFYKLFDKQNGVESQFFCRGWAKSFLWVISAVLHMLSTIIKRSTPVDSLNPKITEGGQLLLDLVAKIGISLINNRFLSFTGSDTSETNTVGSFTEKLCHFKHQTDQVTSLAATCCLHGVLRLVACVDHSVALAKNQGHAISSKGINLSKEERLLDTGILKCSIIEWKNVLCGCMQSFNSVNYAVHNIEVFGRGGPAPGVGIGWGVAGGGFWSLSVLLVQEDARLLVDLLQNFQASLDEACITSQTINCTLEILLSVGPRDKLIAEKALEILLQIPVMKHLSICLSKFLHNGNGGNLSLWECKEDDLIHFSNILISHFRNRWLSRKRKKPKTEEAIRSHRHKPYHTNSLSPIHEDMDDEESASLAVEWANQRLPLPSHWLLSPLAVIEDRKLGYPNRRVPLHEYMHDIAPLKDSTELLDIAKGGLFFLSGIEAIFYSLSENECSPIRSIPLVWKLHSLSVSVFTGMGLLEDERSRNIFEALQRLYGQHLDELRFSASTKGYRISNMNLLSFQSEIHPSYSTFIEILVEQFAAISYGDLTYARQIAIYLHSSVEAEMRLYAWKALSNSRVLELLPSLDNFIAKPEGYLEPIEEDETLLEAYLKSWVSGALDRAATRNSGTYSIALHHLSSFIFNHENGEKPFLRNKIVKSLLRDYSRSQQHETMMLNLMRYSYPFRTQTCCENDDISLQSKRFDILTEACEGNSSLLAIVERLKSASL